VPSHTVFIVHEFIAKNDIIIINYPTYSPDLGPSDFLFPKVKIIMRGKRFEDVENIKCETMKFLKDIKE